MIACITIGTNDLGRAGTFYDAVLGVMGAKRIFANDRIIDWTRASTRLSPSASHMMARRPAANGMMVALAAKDEAEVAAVHAAAIAAGGADEGAPGSRGAYQCRLFPGSRR